MMTMPLLDLSIRSLHKLYQEEKFTPAQVIDYILLRCDEFKDHNIWIHLLSRQQIQPYLDRLNGHSAETLPLFGIPFAIKDNIDLSGIPTTAACPEFSYTPGQSAFVVEQLINAGAIPVGKTNMDQFATGLTGTRSPYGSVKNSINPDYISGGSSSGSAVATATGLVTFALGTDTAGSGRVPAMFNNLVGVKPSCGVVSARGVVPACRSIDCVSLFALNPDDADRIYTVMSIHDDQDSFTRLSDSDTSPSTIRFRFGVIDPSLLQTSDHEIIQLMTQMTERLVALGGTPVSIDFTPFLQAANLLYEGPWIAERYAAIENLILHKPKVIYPVTRSIIEKAIQFSAVQTFQAIYKLRELKHATDAILSTVDFVLTPTASTVYSIKDVDNDPIRLNSLLGYYTNYVNLLDYAAIAIPAGNFSNGLPFGVSLVANRFTDRYLINMSRRILAESGLRMATTGFYWLADNLPLLEPARDRIKLLVCGAHMTGMALNQQLQSLDAEFLEATTTAPTYRLYALAGGPPFRPGLVRDEDSGNRIAVEVWSIDVNQLGKFLAGIPAPLGLGKVELADGSLVIGFICEPYAIDSATDITAYGGWKNYLVSAKRQ